LPELPRIARGAGRIGPEIERARALVMCRPGAPYATGVGLDPASAEDGLRAMVSALAPGKRWSVRHCGGGWTSRRDPPRNAGPHPVDSYYQLCQRFSARF
jgi:hypothetical protein